MFTKELRPKIFRCSIFIKFVSCFYFSLVLFVCDGFGPVQNQVCFGHLGFKFGTGPSPAKVAFRVTLHRVMAAALYRQTCYFWAKEETRKIPIFGGAYRCVCLLTFKIWCYTMRGNWFRSVLTRGIEERSVWSISDWVLFCYLAISIDRRERLGQTPFRSRWSVSSWYRFVGFLMAVLAEIYLLNLNCCEDFAAGGSLSKHWFCSLDSAL
jgi:hypothetical protein